MMDKQDQQRALAMSHDPTNSDRSFHELRLDVDAGRETFTTAEVRSLLACIDSLDAELMAATHEENAAKSLRREAITMLARVQAHRYHEPNSDAMECCAGCGRSPYNRPRHEEGCLVPAIAEVLGHG